MNKKITARFESIDLAERAASFIKSKTEGIKNLSIISRRIKESNKGTVSYPLINPFGEFGSAKRSFSNLKLPITSESYVVDGNVGTELNDRREAYLAIEIDNQNLRRIEHLLRSIGGLDITVLKEKQQH